MKRTIAAVLLCWSGAAVAGVTGNVGVVSEYLLRGIEGSDGAAVQGGVDWTGFSGAYLGAWASNTGGPAAAGASELDIYGGWTGTLGPFGVDLGLVYYWYPEDEEALGLEYDYPEAYAKVALGNFALQLYYATAFYGEANEAAADLAGMDTDGLYVNLLGTWPLSPTLKLVAQLGHSSGDGVEVAWGASYADYGVSLVKTLADGLTVAFGLYDTTLEQGEAFGTLPGGDDEVKAVVGVKKAFAL